MYNQKSVCSGKVVLIPGGSASLKIYFSYTFCRLLCSSMVRLSLSSLLCASYTVRLWILCRHFSAASLNRDKAPIGRGVKALRTVGVSAS